MRKCSGCRPKALTDEGASEAQKTGEEGVRLCTPTSSDVADFVGRSPKPLAKEGMRREEKAQSSGRRAQKRQKSKVKSQKQNSFAT
jgi:hypothetical protein